MKKEQIEKAARKNLKGVVPCEWNQQPFIDIFMIAANWRIKSVWHNSKDLPESNSNGRVKYSILVCFDIHDISPMVVSENNMDLYEWKRDWYGEKYIGRM